MSNVIQSAWNKTKNQLTKVNASPLTWGIMSGGCVVGAIRGGVAGGPVEAGIGVFGAGYAAAKAYGYWRKQKNKLSKAAPC
jgi:hypothetical protein